MAITFPLQVHRISGEYSTSLFFVFSGYQFQNKLCHGHIRDRKISKLLVLYFPKPHKIYRLCFFLQITKPQILFILQTGFLKSVMITLRSSASIVQKFLSLSKWRRRSNRSVQTNFHMPRLQVIRRIDKKLLRIDKNASKKLRMLNLISFF